ncbi:MAG: hypothetical protein U0703_29600 [Anaerolineae bacterium]
MLDVMLARGYRYTACATDDAHFQDRHNDRARHRYGSGAGLTPDSIVEALKRGDYYSSTGPQIFDLQADRWAHRQDSLLPGRIDLRDRQRHAHRVQKHGKGMIEAELDIRRATGSALPPRHHPRLQRRARLVEPHLAHRVIQDWACLRQARDQD